MIQQESQVKVIDNTWAKSGRVIRVLKWSFPTYATVGDKVVIAIKSAVPGWQASKWEVAHAVVVRTRKEVKRPDGSYIRFGDNAVALVGKDWAPRGKRIFWPVAKELRSKWYKTVANMAEEII